ncbi:hypothetical protein B1B_12507, partial [mine drainage metagenome]
MSGGSGAAVGVTAVRLRCGSCGAPYPGGETGEILTCGYCGASQRMVDARQFLDHFRAQVTSFLHQAIPAGLDLTGSTNVDPVARLAAFTASVRPHLVAESEQYRFGLFHLLSTPFVILPFPSVGRAPAGPNPTAVSVFAEKVHAVSGLAVDDASRDLLRRASGVAAAYQSLLVAVGIERTPRPERLHLLAQNLTASADAIDGIGPWAPLAVRLRGLAAQARAADTLLGGGRPDDIRSLLDPAAARLAEARAALAAAPEFGYMVAAVDQEAAAGRILGSMTAIVERSASVPPHPLAFLQRLEGILDGFASRSPAGWGGAWMSLRMREEIFARAAVLRSAQAGYGTVRAVAPTGAPLLVPCWVVELPYTFETGLLWGKRGKEVPERLLVPATFPTDPSTLGPGGASRAITDVFRAGGPSPAIGQLYGRISGRERTITHSGTLGQLLDSTAEGSIAGQAALPPLSTGS